MQRNSAVRYRSGIAGYGSAELARAVSGLLDDFAVDEALRSVRRLVLKPNWVLDRHPDGLSSESLITNAQVIEAVADYAAQKMPAGSSIVIGDAPVQTCDFGRLLDWGISDLVTTLRKKYPRIGVDIEDWRLVHTASRRSFHPIKRSSLEHSDRHTLIDVFGRSFLESKSQRAMDFRVTCYPPSPMRLRHAPGRHQYLVARSALEADLLINLPKLKTHIKAGMTGALKNMVGVNGHKEFLPHHVFGSPANGGDSHQRPSRIRDAFESYHDFHFEHLADLPRPLSTVLSRVLQALDIFSTHLSDRSNFGSWPGNDTVWRTILDLNHLLYAWAPVRPTRIFNLMDAVVAGQADGPMRPRPLGVGVLIAGWNPATVDAAGATVLGYDWRSIKCINEALTNEASLFRAEPSSWLGPRHSAIRPTNWEAMPPPQS